MIDFRQFLFLGRQTCEASGLQKIEACEASGLRKIEACGASDLRKCEGGIAGLGNGCN